MTGKERAVLRKMANGLDTIMQIGKGDIEAASVKQIDDALEARELIKIKVLETCSLSPKEAAQEAAEATGSEIIQVIGSKFVLYRKSKRPEVDILRN